MHSNDVPKVCKNIVLLPGDHIRSKGEIFKVTEKEMYFCKCENIPCEHAYKTTYKIESLQTRKKYQITQHYINQKFAAGEIEETSYYKGKWN